MARKKKQEEEPEDEKIAGRFEDEDDDEEKEVVDEEETPEEEIEPAAEEGEDLQLRKLTADVQASVLLAGPKEARFLVDAYYSNQEQRMRIGGQIRSIEMDARNELIQLLGPALTEKDVEFIKDRKVKYPVVVARFKATLAEKKLDERKLGQLMEPALGLKFAFRNYSACEGQLGRALNTYASARQLGQWAMKIKGIKHILAAGLLAHLDLAQAPTVGHIWRFAGLDPTQKWLGKKKGGAEVERLLKEGYTLETAIPAMAGIIGCRVESLRKFATTSPRKDKDGNWTPIKLTKESLTKAAAKRPWNATLKTLCWKIGESFVKVMNKEDDYYGHVYRRRKDEEIAANEAGKFAEQAAAKLRNCKIGKGTEAYKWYSKGKLPPGHLHARAKRYAVKLFLAHYWETGRRMLGLPVPKPYPIACGGHSPESYIPPPDVAGQAAGGK